MNDDAIAKLTTLVAFLDEIDETDLQDLPNDVASLLNYINLNCRRTVEESKL